MVETLHRSFGVERLSALPAQTLSTIARHDAASEALIRLIQLAIVILFGVLCAASTLRLLIHWGERMFQYGSR